MTRRTHHASFVLSLMLAGAALLAAAASAEAQPYRAQWVGPGPAYWDDPLMWTWPDGNMPPEQYPHDTWGLQYDCRLDVPGESTVLRYDVGVHDVMLDQTLKFVDGAVLQLTSPVNGPLPDQSGVFPDDYPFAVFANGYVHGTGEIRTLGAGVAGTGVVTATIPGENLTLTADEIYLEGTFSASNYGVLTVQSVGIDANGANIEAQFMGDLGLSGWVHGTATIGAHDTGFLTLDTAWIDMPAETLMVTDYSGATVKDSIVSSSVTVQTGSTMDVYNSTFYDELAQSGGTVTLMDTSHLAVARATATSSISGSTIVCRRCWWIPRRTWKWII